MILIPSSVDGVLEVSSFQDQELTKLILAGLNNGIGLSRTLNSYKIDIKKYSEFLGKNPLVKNRLQNSMSNGIKLLYIEGSNHLKAKNQQKWKATRSKVDDFMDRLILWEHTASMEKGQVNEYKFRTAFKICKGLPEEIATALGITHDELWDFVWQQPAIESFLKLNGAI